MLAAESDPVLVPAGPVIGTVAMPRVGRNDKHGSGPDLERLAARGVLVPSAALRNVDQLVVVQYPAPVHVEIVIVGMPRRRGRVNRVSGFDGVLPHGVYGDSPQPVGTAAHEVFERGLFRHVGVVFRRAFRRYSGVNIRNFPKNPARNVPPHRPAAPPCGDRPARTVPGAARSEQIARRKDQIPHAGKDLPAATL